MQPQHQLINTDALAHAVSSKLSGNESTWVFQEECGISETTSFFRLVNATDIHHKIIVGVNTPVFQDEWKKVLLQKKFDQNVSFLKYASEHNVHPLCPSVLAVGWPTADFSLPWVAYRDPDGWPLASNWHQLKEDVRSQVVHNLATFVRGLANVNVPPARTDASVDYIGSTSTPHVFFPPTLALKHWLDYSEMNGVDNHGSLVGALADKRARSLESPIPGLSTRSLPVQQLEAITLVVSTILDRNHPRVLAHLNLTPQNVWVDPFNGTITGVFGWEYAHFAPVWMATTPLPWLLNEKLDSILAEEKECDPWMVWRPRFHHPPHNTAREMRGLRTVWETTIRSEIGDHVLSRTTFADDALYRSALRACFVESEKLGDSVQWARGVVKPFLPWWRHIPVLASMVLAMLVTIYGIAGRHRFASLFGQSNMLKGGVLFAVLALSAAFALPFRPRRLQRAKRGKDVLFDTATATHFMTQLDPISIKTKLFDLSKRVKTRDEPSSVTSVPCSPANSIQAKDIYVPNFCRGLRRCWASERGAEGFFNTHNSTFAYRL
ncbi:hypothetical protein CPB86DRAFT_756639 [Serendipita vermifera]|nr:hypothetical protein CPB86DRAFT_756639 [Serendipita vermifera]